MQHILFLVITSFLHSFSSFRPTSKSEVSEILFNCPNEQSDPDPVPTWLLKVMLLQVMNTVKLLLFVYITFLYVVLQVDC